LGLITKENVFHKRMMFHKASCDRNLCELHNPHIEELARLPFLLFKFVHLMDSLANTHFWTAMD
jgi:hypothetical protein